MHAHASRYVFFRFSWSIPFCQYDSRPATNCRQERPGNIQKDSHSPGCLTSASVSLYFHLLWMLQSDTIMCDTRVSAHALRFRYIAIQCYIHQNPHETVVEALTDPTVITLPQPRSFRRTCDFIATHDTTNINSWRDGYVPTSLRYRQSRW